MSYKELVMSRFQLNRVLFVLFGVAAVLVAVTVAQATPIAFSGIYDGSYDPYTATPPAGQSTWYGFGGSASISPVPNYDNGVPTPGVATFKDDSTGARLCIKRTYANGNTFSSTQANDEYVYEARIKFYSDGAATGGAGGTTGRVAVAAVGFRDEYSGSAKGKCVMLGWLPSDTSHVGLYLVPHGTDVIADTSGTKITATDYFDDEWHTYRVEKYIDGEDVTQVDVRVDNVLLGTYAYSSLPNASATSVGSVRRRARRTRRWTTSTTAGRSFPSRGRWRCWPPA